MPRPKPGDPIMVPRNALCVVEYAYVDNSGTVREAWPYAGSYFGVTRKLRRLGPHTIAHSRVTVMDCRHNAPQHERAFAEPLFEIDAEEWKDRGATGIGVV